MVSLFLWLEATGSISTGGANAARSPADGSFTVLATERLHDSEWEEAGVGDK
jgi:hypothetical protein